MTTLAEYQIPRPSRCPACGDWCELTPVPSAPTRLHLLDIGVSAKGLATQRVLGNHACQPLQERPAQRRPTYQRSNHRARPHPPSVGARHAVPIHKEAS
jgi:hypothetical protein